LIAIGAIGYAAVGALYALLTVLLIATWRGHRIGIFLILASVISVAWGFLLAAQIAYGSINPLLVVFTEVLRASAWILFLGVLAARIGASRILLVLSFAVPLVVLGWIGFSTYRGMIPGDQVVDVGSVFIRGGLALSLLGLVLIEQLYRNSPIESKWSLKPLVLGLGGIFAFDLFLFSQGVLLNALDTTTWLARGAVNLLFVPMIAIAARRNKDWELRIFVSRHVVFYSTTLTAVGLYLLLMSFGGYLIILYGGSWGGLARIVFFVGAFVVLISLLFSSTLRARLKVFLNKHFFHNKYEYRDEWLRLVATLSDFDDSVAREVAIKAIAQIVNSPSGILWVRDDVGSDFRVIARFKTEDEAPNLQRSEPVVTFIEKNGWLVDLGEYAQHPERYENLEMPDWIRSQESAWLLVPLQSSGELLGLILLYQAPGYPSLNYEDRDLLKTVGNHIAVHIAQARSDSLLAESQQFEAYNRLTAFLMHDLSNLVAQQSLIVTNAEKHKHNPEFIDDAISTIAGSVERMKKVIRRLKSGDGARSAKWTELRFIVSAAIDRCAAMKPLPSLESHAGDVGVVADAEEFTMVLAHLIRNAQDACSKDGSVAVSVHESEGHAHIEIADNGEGMSKMFIRDRLFRPFDSTKGSQGMGIGAYQAREFVRRLGGELVVRSKPGEGTCMTLQVPIAARD
jgi:putative PEP-CTERM system histidine kinase